MHSPIDEMAMREDEHASGSTSGSTDESGTHTSTSTVVTFTTTAATAAQGLSGVQVPIMQTSVATPAVHFTAPKVITTSSIQNQQIPTIFGWDISNGMPLTTHPYTASTWREYAHGLPGSQPLHSTLNNIEGNRPANVFQRCFQQSQGNTIRPLDVFASSSSRTPWQNYSHNCSSATQIHPPTVHTWPRQTSMPYSGADTMHRNPLFSAGIHRCALPTQQPSLCAHTLNNEWTPSSCYIASSCAMPSPISCTMTQPVGMTSYTHPSCGAPFASETLRNMCGTVPDITLSTSQIASRQVMTKDLPSFSGRPEEWPLFITNYVQSTERCGFTDQENLLRLQKCLKGEALKAVSGKLMMPDTVSSAIETLKMLFGRPEVIHQTMQHRLKQEPPVRSDKLQSLIQFALSVQNYCATIRAIGLGDYLNDPMLLTDLVNKLPSDLRLDWGRYQMAFVRVDIGIFDSWLFNLATCASKVTFIVPSSTDTNEEVKRTCKQHKQRVMMHEVVETKGNPESRQIVCPQCNEDHHLADCGMFGGLSVHDRWKFVRSKGLCFRCFKKHQIRRCNLTKQCGVDNCKMPHHALLHSNYSGPDKQSSAAGEREDKASGSGIQQPIVSLHVKDRMRAMFRYVPVRLFGKEKSLDTYALIDEGSACTLVESSIAKELELEGPTAELCLKWTGDITQSETDSKVVSLDISSADGGLRRFRVKNVRTISNLDLPVQTLEASVMAERPHLRDLPMRPYRDVRARILIGLDNAKLGVPLETRQADDDDLVATRCNIGWAIYGRNETSFSAPQRVLHVCPCSSTDKLDEMLRAYFSLESVGVSATAKAPGSKEDERARMIMHNSSKYLSAEQRWETGLLWKYNSVELPDSLPMARSRLQCLESKMKRDPELAEFLVDTIRSYEQKGYVRKLAKEEISVGGKSWYIPIFTVKNPHKNKRRLVWDAAATVNDVSLNTVLLKGPDLLTSLVGVLIRFREKSVAITGDIKEMFHQVIVRKEDQTAQKFLWRDGDSSRDPDVYVMQVMTFGASCSPTLANFIKNQNARQWEEHHPKEVHAIITNTYVDDWLQSVDTEDEMIQMATTVRSIHEKGGFEMRNWSSNSRRVLAALSGSTAQKERCFDEPNSLNEKVLGLWWMPETDEFTFLQRFDDTIFDESSFPTKRQILKALMTIFDPLGFLGFYIIHAKVILQNIWRSGVGWDQPIREEERLQWWQWVRRLPLIAAIRIPRCYAFVSSSDELQLHTFVDASVNAFAAVSYLRAGREGSILCSFVASKTRVAPLKPISIPRMELMAAILGLRLAKFIEDEMSVRITRRVFWTDSRNVLCWIRSDARKYHQFVALRIGEILEGSDVNEWRWVPTAHNVADEGTKLSNNLEFNGQSRWFTGPDFLIAPEAEWPEGQVDGVKSLEQELVHHIAEKETLSTLAIISPDPSRFSRWEKMRSVQRYVLQFLRLVVKERCDSELMKVLVNARGIIGAEAVIIRRSQEEAYSEELTCLQSGNRVSCKSSIFRCSPYCDERGILRVHGRVDVVSGIPTRMKRPIIMPRKHPVTHLIADFYHRKFHHHHNEIVVNEMRQRFFISGLRALVKTVANRCQHCRNRKASPSSPSMGSLPAERLSPFTLAFTFTGVDYFGPMDVAVGRRREKRWGVLFSCLTTRAVHIEISSSLSTESFLLVLKQFISRRGVPRRILSDNGTNFRGASRILAQEIEKVSSGQLEQEYPEIEWRFIPPASPHMGGAWERMIRSVKSIMMEILHENVVREEVLRATLADIEHILNSRPLTYVPLDSPDSEALTPNHFLVGSSSGIRERGIEDGCGTTLRRNFNLTNQLANQFWKRWIRDYLPSVTRRTKWFQPPLDPIGLHDVVIIVDENSKRNTWKKGIVVDLHRSRDGEARSAVVKTTNGLVTRPIIKLAKLDVSRQVNSTLVMDA